MTNQTEYGFRKNCNNSTFQNTKYIHITWKAWNPKKTRCNYTSYSTRQDFRLPCVFYTTYNPPTRNTLLQTNRNNPLRKITHRVKLIRRNQIHQASIILVQRRIPACHLSRTKPIPLAQFLLRLVEIRGENFDGDPAKRLGVLINRTTSSDPVFRENGRIRRKRDNPGLDARVATKKNGNSRGTRLNERGWRSEHRRSETFQWAGTGRAARLFFFPALLLFSFYSPSEHACFFPLLSFLSFFLFFLFLFLFLSLCFFFFFSFDEKGERKGQT